MKYQHLGQPLLSISSVYATILSVVLSTACLGQSGLDFRASIGPFLNGRLPTVTPANIDNTSGGAQYEIVDAFPNLKPFISHHPLHLMPVPRSTNMLLGDQTGLVYTFWNNQTATSLQLLLDLSATTQSVGDSGLVGLTIHPQYGTGSGNDFIYVYYRYRPQDLADINPAYMRVSRFSWPVGATTINPASEQILINQFDRHNFHQGGGMVFGSDGYLYITVGDEGGPNDQFNSTQRLDGGLFSGVLRIDVDRNPNRSHPIRRQPIGADNARPAGWNDPTFTANYYIPNDNPWQSPGGDLLEEYYAIGLRSPHRMTRDPITNSFWIGDIGEAAREEISILQRGGNFQWPYREGDIAGPSARPAQLIGTDIAPVHSYGRDVGGCVIGGYVYRGSQNPDLVGKYIFVEFLEGKVFAMEPGVAPVQIAAVPRGLILGMGIDQEGELYFLKRFDGAESSLLRLQDANASGQQNAPSLLSQTGAFTAVTQLQPASGVLPYDVIQELWSDGASKRRWMAVPHGPGVVDNQITFSSTGNWDFPRGTVLIKHFEFPGKKLETRFTVLGNDDEWYGITYQWNDQGTDAELVTGIAGLERQVVINGEDRIWYYPSRTECFSCHTPAKGRVLGPKTRHLNKSITYPSTGRTANQLVTLNNAGYFSNPQDISLFPAMLTAANITDTSAPLETRVRSYLDINCSHCHTGGGVSRANFEADMLLPMFWQNIINATPVNTLGIADAKVVFPSDEAKSVLYLRANTLDGCCAMPPLAKNDVDRVALTQIRSWIRALTPTQNSTNLQFSRASNDTLRITWNAHPFASRYEIYRSDVGLIGTSSSPTFVDTSINTGANSTYFVVAIDPEEGRASSFTSTKILFGQPDLHILFDGFWRGDNRYNTFTGQTINLRLSGLTSQIYQTRLQSDSDAGTTRYNLSGRRGNNLMDITYFTTSPANNVTAAMITSRYQHTLAARENERVRVRVRPRVRFTTGPARRLTLTHRTSVVADPTRRDTNRAVIIYRR